MAVSGEMRDYLARRNPALPARCSSPTASPPACARAGPIPCVSGWPPRARPPGAARRRSRVIGSAGRLVPMKNHALLIRAYARLRAAGIPCRLVILGDGPLRASSRRSGARCCPTSRCASIPSRTTCWNGWRTWTCSACPPATARACPSPSWRRASWSGPSVCTALRGHPRGGARQGERPPGPPGRPGRPDLRPWPTCCAIPADRAALRPAPCGEDVLRDHDIGVTHAPLPGGLCASPGRIPLIALTLPSPGGTRHPAPPGRRASGDLPPAETLRAPGGRPAPQGPAGDHRPPPRRPAAGGGRPGRRAPAPGPRGACLLPARRRAPGPARSWAAASACGPCPGPSAAPTACSSSRSCGWSARRATT